MMKSRLISFLCLFISIIFTASCSDFFFGCGQRITGIEVSPDKTKTMYWVARDCGATTVPTITVSIVPESELKKIGPEGQEIGKKFVLMSYERGLVRAEWLSENTIEVLYDHSKRYGREGSFFKQKTKIGDVKITYQEMKYQDWE